MGAVGLGALLLVFAGISQAGGVMHKSSGDERPAVKTTSQEFSFAEFGEGGPPMEYWEALGTGSMSSGDERPAVKTTSQEFSFAELGEGGPPPGWPILFPESGIMEKSGNGSVPKEKETGEESR